MFAVLSTATPLVFTVKVPVEEPADTLTVDCGSVAAALSLLSEIVTADGAAALSVTVPALETPPSTVTGFNVRLWISSGVMVRSADGVDPL